MGALSLHNLEACQPGATVVDNLGRPWEQLSCGLWSLRLGHNEVATSEALNAKFGPIVSASDHIARLNAEREELAARVREAINLLGPDDVCTCPPSDPDCGLKTEALEALRVLRDEHGQALRRA